MPKRYEDLESNVGEIGGAQVPEEHGANAGINEVFGGAIICKMRGVFSGDGI